MAALACEESDNAIDFFLGVSLAQGLCDKPTGIALVKQRTSANKPTHVGSLIYPVPRQSVNR